MSSGYDQLSGGLNQSQVDTTPAVWMSALQHVGDCQYVDDGVDEVLLRALNSRVVYAGSCCCHHEMPFEDLTITAIAAVEKQYQKKKRDYSLVPPIPKGLLKPFRKPVTEMTLDEIRAAHKQAAAKERTATYREGRSLTEVVAEMFPT